MIENKHNLNSRELYNHRRKGRWAGEAADPPKFWGNSDFWAAREIWVKPVFKDVVKLFIEFFFYFYLKSVL